jgi:hypothetical protein
MGAGVSRETLLKTPDLGPQAGAGGRLQALVQAVAGGARLVEIGAGPGLLGEHARAAARPDLRNVATDVVAVPGFHLVADALPLPFRDGSLDAVLVLDVIHNGARPGTSSPRRRAACDRAASSVRPALTASPACRASLSASVRCCPPQLSACLLQTLDGALSSLAPLLAPRASLRWAGPPA